MTPEIPPVLPEGQRHDDPPKHDLWFRVKLAVAKYPVMVGVTIALAIATVALVVVLRQQERLATQADELVREKVSNQNLLSAQVKFCDRLQTERTRVNRLASIIYLTLDASGKRERSLAHVENPKDPHAVSARVLTALANESEWGPATDCDRAINDARHYVNPTPQPFTVEVAAHFIPKAAKILLAASQDPNP